MSEIVQKDLFGEDVVDKQPISREKITDILRGVFHGMTLEDLTALFTDKFRETLNYYDLCHGAKTCQRMSLLFNPHRLDVRSITSKMSVYEAFQDERWFNGLARVVILNKGTVSDVLYQSIAMNINGVQYINEFPPHVARGVYSKYVTKNARILDPCAGWGGRMIGASTVADSYTAFEPSTKTHEGLLKLSEYLRTMQPDFETNVKNIPFEEAQLTSNYYDVALTSPPYYDTEHYSTEATNSMNKFATFDAWCEGFYLPMIEKTMDALKPDSYFILNIGSRKYPLNQVLIDNFKVLYSVDKEQSFLSGQGTGLNKSGEGETFYRLHKNK